MGGQHTGEHSPDNVPAASARQKGHGGAAGTDLGKSGGAVRIYSKCRFQEFLEMKNGM